MTESPSNPLARVALNSSSSPSLIQGRWAAVRTVRLRAGAPTPDQKHHKQGRINLMLNRDDGGQVAGFRGEHGPSASAMAFRVSDPDAALDWALHKGATRTEEEETVILGIGGSYLYFIQDGTDPYANWAEYPGWQAAEAENNVGLDLLDHLSTT